MVHGLKILTTHFILLQSFPLHVRFLHLSFPLRNQNSFTRCFFEGSFLVVVFILVINHISTNRFNVIPFEFIWVRHYRNQYYLYYIYYTFFLPLNGNTAFVISISVCIPQFYGVDGLACYSACCTNIVLYFTFLSQRFCTKYTSNHAPFVGISNPIIVRDSFLSLSSTSVQCPLLPCTNAQYQAIE